ncbi:hypothetical protein [Actinoplanes teichomyceticus]|uniref:Uncharacterized protein n=1 Tax=Actinoplanes teichomyceticus TaxID=1867 RepID=A0A561WK05_ACTTI|nr:hypothetical protein [Actinoplanes teichomyceticus]TWG24178.1 hypothetical protein FHX34_102731 [Actinoplanes teichomyceticus]GIF12975.1 hypothetical protein Ate01nite_30070 [Actinoplanes teichomyceticus]
MDNLTLALTGAGKVLLASLLLGAGLPALFALGIRSLAYGGARAHEPATTGPRAQVAGTIAGYVCFAVVLLGVLLGITFIVATGLGKALSFEHVFPVLVDKH